MTAKATTTTTTTKANAKKPAADVPMATCPAGRHKVPVRSFPTEQRVVGKKLVECRKCRDARYATAKANRS